MRRVALVALAAALAGGAAACNDDGNNDDGNNDNNADSAESADSAACAAGESSPDEYPDVVEAEADEADDGAWTFTVTMTSPYDSPERYADGWRVLGPDCTVYGVHALAHDHANEQPFTRTQSGVEIPDTVDEVTIEGRDQDNGFGGSVRTVTLDRD